MGPCSLRPRRRPQRLGMIICCDYRMRFESNRWRRSGRQPLGRQNLSTRPSRLSRDSLARYTSPFHRAEHSGDLVGSERVPSVSGFSGGRSNIRIRVVWPRLQSHRRSKERDISLPIRFEKMPHMPRQRGAPGASRVEAPSLLALGKLRTGSNTLRLVYTSSGLIHRAPNGDVAAGGVREPRRAPVARPHPTVGLVKRPIRCDLCVFEASAIEQLNEPAPCPRIEPGESPPTHCRDR